MRIESAISYLFVNMVYIYIVYRYMELFFKESRVSRHWCVTVYVFFYLANSAVHLCAQNLLYNISTSLAGIFLVTCIYRSYWRKRVAATLMIYIICMIVDIVTASLVGDYVLGKELSIMNNIISYFLMFALEIFLEKVVELKEDYFIFKRRFWTAFGVPVMSLGIVHLLVFTKSASSRVLVLASMGLLFINILVFYLYDVIAREYNEKYKMMILQREVEEYKNELQIITHNQKKIHALKHDMHHHALALKNLAENGKNEEIKKYLDEIIERVNNHQEYVSSGNKDIDSILNYLIQKSIEHGISVETDIKISKDMEIDLFDLNVIFGNLFDNATEAAEKANPKEIQLSLEYDRNILYIQMRNTYAHKIKMTAEKEFITTKKNKKEHGYGIQNIKMIIEKYNGDMEIVCEDRYFVFDAMLYCASKKENMDFDINIG